MATRLLARTWQHRVPKMQQVVHQAQRRIYKNWWSTDVSDSHNVVNIIGHFMIGNQS